MVVQLVWHRLLESSQLRKHHQVKDRTAILLRLNLKKKNLPRNRQTRITSQTNVSNQNELLLQHLGQVEDVEYGEVLDLKGKYNGKLWMEICTRLQLFFRLSMIQVNLY